MAVLTEANERTAELPSFALSPRTPKSTALLLGADPAFDSQQGLEALLERPDNRGRLVTPVIIEDLDERVSVLESDDDGMTIHHRLASAALRRQAAKVHLLERD